MCHAITSEKLLIPVKLTRPKILQIHNNAEPISGLLFGAKSDLPDFPVSQVQGFLAVRCRIVASVFCPMPFDHYSLFHMHAKQLYYSPIVSTSRIPSCVQICLVSNEFLLLIAYFNACITWRPSSDSILLVNYYRLLNESPFAGSKQCIGSTFHSRGPCGPVRGQGSSGMESVPIESRLFPVAWRSWCPHKQRALSLPIFHTIWVNDIWE